MDDSTTTKTTVRLNEQFADEIRDRYPAATSLPQALLAAAQDGVDFRSAIEGDLESLVRDTVADELHDADSARTLLADD